MRKSLTLLLFVALLLPAPVQAGAPIMIPDQGILGGHVIDLAGISNNSTTLSVGGDMTATQIVEVYTATWCENCVDSEHALMDALEGEDATVLVHHRYIGESQDPFGSQAGDERWIDLYGETSKSVANGLERAAPTVVFDGYRFVAGSAPNGESLESDYSEMFADKHEYRSWNGVESDFTWTGDNSSGVITWQMGIHPDEPEFMSWTHRLMVVEHSGYFPDGGNGLEHYDDLVRAVIELNVTANNGTTVGGEQAITLPDAYDGDDLSLVVVHEWNQETPEIVIEPAPDEGLLPGFLAPLGLIALGAAALVRRE
ncbi:MAG: hypothetical protein P8Q90_01665 [Candidatus Thalassarchaeaceae archaeon]|nr:hypothetical protein [Candidatus Thalassarchaeaceae archaeon]